MSHVLGVQVLQGQSRIAIQFTPLSSHGSKCFGIMVDWEWSEKHCFVLLVGFCMKWHPLELLFQLARCTVQVPLASAPPLQPVTAALPWCLGLMCTWSSGVSSRAESALYCGRHSSPSWESILRKGCGPETIKPWLPKSTRADHVSTPVILTQTT